MRPVVLTPRLVRLSCGAITLLFYAACGPGLPSTVPLGGTEVDETASVVERASAPGRGALGSKAASPESDADESADAEASDQQDAETFEVTDKATDSEADTESDQAPDSAPKGTKAPSHGQANQCDDSGGSAPDCASLDTGACGSLFGPMCGVLKRAIKPKVASVIATCMEEKNRNSACSEVDECIDQGLDLVCVDDESKVTCRKVLKRCPAPKSDNPWSTQERCERGLSAVVASQREKTAECLQADCSLAKCFFPSKQEH